MGCAEFCRDKGVKISMSIKQKWLVEAKQEGKRKCCSKDYSKALTSWQTHQTGLLVDDALKLVNGNPPVEAESG